jgi:uncharacterized protein Smg (DUF494 family)
MKIKKLLSIGALSLVVACSTSIGASAAEKPTNEKIKSDMISMFLSNKSPLNYNVNASTVVNASDIEKLKQDLKDNGFYQQDYTTLFAAIGLIDSSKTIVDNAKTIVVTLSNENKLDDLVSDVRNLMTVLREIENTNAEAKAAIENDIKVLVKGSNSTLDVTFGKNIDGKITMSITQGSQIVLQLNSGNAYTISDSLGTNADKLKTYAEALKLLS